MIKVIGAGLGRTGTHSLAAALDKLGFGPCYTIFDMKKHHAIWQSALDGQPINWIDLFNNFQSTMEWPAVLFLQDLVNVFPEAKVVLTLRNAESWYASAASTIFPSLEATAQHPDPEIRKRASLSRKIVLHKQFNGEYWDKAKTINVYQNHIQTVTSLIPKDNLLCFDVKSGWQPLCSFLGVDVPSEPFPRVNTEAEMLASAPDWAVKVMEENRIKREQGLPVKNDQRFNSTLKHKSPQQRQVTEGFEIT